jgi:hypothetical protein
MKKLIFFFSLLTALLTFQSCEKDPVADPGSDAAPQLPPEQSFIMPFDGFEDADTTGLLGKVDAQEKSGPHTFRNWFHAAGNVVVWNHLIGLSTGIPVISFREAFNHDAEYAGNGIFIWAYQFPADGKIYKASLSGQFINNNSQIKWEMHISQVGGFTDVLWYSGIVSEDLTKATWTLNHKPESPEPFISIDYDYDKKADAFSIRYTNIIPGDPGNGGYIEYQTNPGGDFNRAYDVFLPNNKLLQIEWNKPGNDGRVKDPVRFNDNDWHCWNGQLRDVDC